MRIIEVAACVLKLEKKILISLRPREKAFCGFYEFPGGKINKNELVIEALYREIYEELGVEINLNNVNFLQSYSVNQMTKKIKLNFFFCTNWRGKVFSKEGQILRWIYPNEIENYNMLKSNRKFIKFLLNFIFPATY